MLHLLVVLTEFATLAIKLALIFVHEYNPPTRAYILCAIIAMDVVMCSLYATNAGHRQFAVILAVTVWTVSIGICPILFIIVNVPEHMWMMAGLYLALGMVGLITFMIMDMVHWHVGAVTTWALLCMVPLVYGLKTIIIWWILYGGVASGALLMAWCVHLLWPELGWHSTPETV